MICNNKINDIVFYFRRVSKWSMILSGQQCSLLLYLHTLSIKSFSSYFHMNAIPLPLILSMKDCELRPEWLIVVPGSNPGRFIHLNDEYKGLYRSL